MSYPRLFPSTNASETSLFSGLVQKITSETVPTYTPSLTVPIEPGKQSATPPYFLAIELSFFFKKKKQVLYISLPVVIPAFVSLVILRLSLASRSSRVRIKQLEEEAHTTGQQKLADTLAELEREVEEAVVDLIDSPDISSSTYQPSQPSSTSTSSSLRQPIISPNHKKIVNWLNLLPIKKEIAYFPGVRNSHPIIVCRDVEHFESHRKGEGVLRHWADSFIL